MLRRFALMAVFSACALAKPVPVTLSIPGMT